MVNGRSRFSHHQDLPNKPAACVAHGPVVGGVGCFPAGTTSDKSEQKNGFRADGGPGQQRPYSTGTTTATPGSIVACQSRKSCRGATGSAAAGMTVAKSGSTVTAA